MRSYFPIVLIVTCILAFVAPFALAASIEPRVKSQEKPGPAKAHRENFKAAIVKPLKLTQHKKFGFADTRWG